MVKAEIPFIDQIVNAIVSITNPDKIILFGSRARGDYGSDSDLDILILKKGLKNEREVTDSLYMDFFDKKIPVAVDLIAMDYDRYYRLNNDVGYIYKAIEREGRVLYGIA
ncbi:nucleotidyltransferases [Fibrobacteres bacterium R8-0-B4]